MVQQQTKISLEDYEVIIRSVYNPPDLQDCCNIGSILGVISQQRRMMPNFFSSLDRRRADMVRHDSLVVLLKVGLEQVFEDVRYIEQPEISRQGDVIPDIICTDPKIPISFDNLEFYSRSWAAYPRSLSRRKSILPNPNDPTAIEVKTGGCAFMKSKFVPQLVEYERRIGERCNKLLYYHPDREKAKIYLVL